MNADTLPLDAPAPADLCTAADELCEPKLRTAALRALLRARFKPEEWAYFDEVPDATGFQKSRTLDALAVNCWRSRGMELWGFEIKASRSDWLKELRAPQKAEAVCRYCDRFYLVVGDRTIVQPGELPPTWGLIVPRSGGLVIAREAPKLAAQPISREFFAAVCRRAAALSADEAAIKAGVEKVIEERKAAWRQEMPHHQRRVEQDLNELRRAVKEFEAASGVRLETWRAGDIGAAVKLVLDGNLARYRHDLEYLAAQALRIHRQITDRLAAGPEEVHVDV